MVNSNITVEFVDGRFDEYVKVLGANNLQEARLAALDFCENEGMDTGITLNDGHYSTWIYDEPQPDDWVDSFNFNYIDKEPLPAEYYEY